MTVFETVKKVWPEPFNSLSRDHMASCADEKEAPPAFQLPLSGSQADLPRVIDRRGAEGRFQLPLSGSQQLALDDESRLARDFQLPLSGSLVLWRLKDYEVITEAFNSLSRDHGKHILR